MTKITQETVKTFFHYDPETGEFIRRMFIDNQGNLYPRSSPVRSKHQSGYYIASIEGKRYRVHHLIFIYMVGKPPEGFVDHVNGNRTDNRWGNLRVVTRQGNQKNQGVRKDCSSGRTGVYWYKPLMKYQAQITICGKRVHLGYYSDFESAVLARRAAEDRFDFHPNHGERPSWGN